MNILCRLTVRNLKKNTKRTLVTVVGIILATALLTAVANLAESFRASVILYEKEEIGDFHYSFEGVQPEELKYFENNPNIEKMSVAQEVGYALLENSANPDKPYFYICAVDEQCRQMTALRLRSGRWPENENEIVISTHMRSNGGNRLVIGDKVTLTLGTRDLGEGYAAHQDNPYTEEESFVPSVQKEYTVVGVMERPGFGIEGYMAPGYTAVTCPGEKAGEWTRVYVSYNKSGMKKRTEVTQGLRSLARGSQSANSRLISWETMLFSNSTMNLFYGMGGIALFIIIVTGVFCIRNAFQISLTEKMRLYGMLTSVGATSKQRRRMVYYEGFLLGIIGIPLGVGSGALATYILTKVCSEMLRYAIDIKLVYAFSLRAALAGAVLAAVTIFFSAFSSARRAAKLSPISAIRSNETVRRGRRELRVPGYVKGLFGIGGVLAYKNLRRSRVKYRTTVLSIVVSTAIFIAMTTFVNLGFKAAQGQYAAGDFPLVITLMDEEREAEAALILSFEEVQGYVMRRGVPAHASKKHIPFTQDFISLSREHNWDKGFWDTDDSKCGISVYSMGREPYEAYCRQVGVEPEEAAKGAIVYAEYRLGVDDGSGMKYYEGSICDFQPGSSFDLLNYTGEAEDEVEAVSLPVVCQTRVRPGWINAGMINESILCIVSDQWMDEHLSEYLLGQINLYLKCEDADALEIRLWDEVPMYSYYISNYEKLQREQRSFWLMTAIFLYGFITVIALIGITNIFNTVTTNMELRSREFAMLKSVGMTEGEFRRMVQLESVFYGGRSLCMGIPLGCLLSWLFYRAFGAKTDMPFSFPIPGIVISVAAVVLLLLVIMRYSMARINRKNIIETIMNENI